MTSRERIRWVFVGATVAGAGGLALGLIGLAGPGDSPGPRAARATAPSTPGRGGTLPGVTTVATVLRAAPRYASPGRRGRGTVPSSWWDRPSVLPVIATRPGWDQVRLAQRPNGSTAWVPASGVRLSSTPYRIVIDLATTHLMLYKNGRLVLSAPAGVGAADDPTPAGEYFVAFTEPPMSAGYGPFVLVTSAHSPDIADWSASGDAIIGIHGPLGEDTAIGTSGARISHGCVRLHLADQEQLSGVPPGTPIDITSAGLFRSHGKGRTRMSARLLELRR